MAPNAIQDWLPPLLCFSECDGDWNQYVEALYAVFQRDFRGRLPDFQGRPLRLKRFPMEQGKEATFWHFIQDGPVEADRLPNLRRCERIRWPRPIIEAHVVEGRIYLWANTRMGKSGRGEEKRWVLALPDFSYVVILADRGNFLMPWTAYEVEEPHQRRKLRKECEAYHGLPG